MFFLLFYKNVTISGGFTVVTERVLPQEHVAKNKALWDVAVHGLRQEQEGSQRPYDDTSDIAILFIRNFRSFSEGVPKQGPNPKRIRTERTLAENRVVLI